VQPAMVVPRGKERTCIVFHGCAWLWKEHLKTVNFHGIIYLTIYLSPYNWHLSFRLRNFKIVPS
jgi:hypothetical protein